MANRWIWGLAATVFVFASACGDDDAASVGVGGSGVTSTGGGDDATTTTGGLGGAGGQAAPTFVVRGTLTGAFGAVTLSNQGETLQLTEDGAFAFATALENGASFDVTLSAFPGIQSCVVDGGVGTIAGADAEVTVRCEGKLLIRADDGVVGCEPYLTDGTAAGTQRLADVHPTAGSLCEGEADPPARLGDKLIFLARDASHGTEMWVTDGTPEGTNLIVDLAPGTIGGGLRRTAVFDGKLYGRGVDGELWSTDGTAAGSGRVAEINANGNASVDSLTVVGNELFFVASTGGQRRVWKTDGTEAGTVQALSTPLANNVSTILLVEHQGKLYFRGEFNGDDELFVSDGTDAGTTVLDLDPATSAEPSLALSVGGLLYYTAFDAALGRELHVTDGTLAGTTVIDTQPGAVSGSPESFGALQGQVLLEAVAPPRFLLTDGVQLTELATFATPPGTPLILNSRAFFSAADATAGFELWSTDGTAAGTARVADIEAGPVGSFPNMLGKVPNEEAILFRAFTTAAGAELWRSDGTEAGTQLVLDINPGAASGLGADDD